MKQSKLPEQFETMTIGKMVSGDIGFTLPWGMFVDANRDLWMHPEYPFFTHPEKEARLRIMRVGDSIKVDIASCGCHTWEPGTSSWDMLPNKLPVTLARF